MPGSLQNWTSQSHRPTYKKPQLQLWAIISIAYQIREKPNLIYGQTDVHTSCTHQINTAGVNNHDHRHPG